MAEFTVHLPDGTSKIISGFVGQYVEMAGDTPPAHTLLANGAAVSRTVYAELFEVIGTTYGAGDGSTTFNLPDLTGKFLRGTGGNAAALGEAQNDAIQNLTGHLFIPCAGSSIVTSDGYGALFSPRSTPAYAAVPDFNNITNSYGIGFDASRVVPTAEENRPVNMSCTICIVYE